MVESFYNALDTFDDYDNRNVDETENFFVKKLQMKKEESAKVRSNKPESWLDWQPYLKVDFKSEEPLSEEA